MRSLLRAPGAAPGQLRSRRPWRRGPARRGGRTGGGGGVPGSGDVPGLPALGQPRHRPATHPPRAELDRIPVTGRRYQAYWSWPRAARGRARSGHGFGVRSGEGRGASALARTARHCAGGPGPHGRESAERSPRGRGAARARPGRRDGGPRPGKDPAARPSSPQALPRPYPRPRSGRTRPVAALYGPPGDPEHPGAPTGLQGWAGGAWGAVLRTWRALHGCTPRQGGCSGRAE